ncbi:MAG: flagellar biosynthesis anti-sigma factor FlgM [Phycisphaerales bacterium]|nr:MAG: flagellar biosynthesis anti-sigma factor FlgM [Phycisphaerales bacterium]
MYNCDFTENSSGGTALLAQERPPEIREDKVLAVRQLLDEGRYGIAERLDEVIETLLELFGG